MKDTLFVAKKLPSGYVALYVPGQPTKIVSGFTVYGDVVDTVEGAKGGSDHDKGKEISPPSDR